MIQDFPCYSIVEAELRSDGARKALREIFSRHFERIRTPIQSVLGVSIGVVEVDAAASSRRSRAPLGQRTAIATPAARDGSNG